MVPFRRKHNPIFIEEEHQEFGKRHSVGPKYLFITITFLIVIGVLYFFLQ